jgi:hypothetical protein
MDPAVSITASMGHDVAICTSNENGGSAMELKIVGIDLAKSVFHLHGVNARGKALYASG